MGSGEVACWKKTEIGTKKANGGNHWRKKLGKMDGTTHNPPPKIRQNGAMRRSNTTHCGQILSADQIKEHAGKWKNYGIDKLKFSFRLSDNGFSIKPNYTPDTWIEQLTAPGGTGNGAAPKRKLYKNTPHYQASIQRFGFGGSDIVDDYLLIQMNPSKILHPYNLITDTNAIADMIVGLQKDLVLDGIEIDYEKAEVSRLDIAHNMKLEDDIQHYQKVMDSFYGKRQMKKTHSETRYWANNENQFIVYPKNRELQNSLSKELMPAHELTRAEMKMLTKRCIQSKMGDCRLGYLITDDMEYVKTFNEFVRQSIFRSNQYIQPKIDFGELYKIYEKAYQYYGNRAYDVILKSLGIIQLSELNGIDNFLSILSQFHNDRYVRRKRAELTKLLNVFSESNYEKTPDYLRRYNELKDKMIIKIAA